MKIIYIIATLYLGVLGILALFSDYTKLHWFWKSALGLFAIAFIILSFGYQQVEKNMEEAKRGFSERSAQHQRQKIEKKLDDLHEKEKKGLFTDTDYLNRMCLYLEELNLTLRNRDDIIRKQYLTIYFKEVEKIPTFYTWEEWKATEKILFERMLRGLKGHFNVRGMYASGAREKIESEFMAEREKYIKAKEREFEKLNTAQ